jgi:HK97 family phage portal protein
MKLLDYILGRRDEQRAAPAELTGPSSYGLFQGMGGTDSGVTVNETTALQASAVFACCRIIAESIAALPVHVRSRKNGGKDYDHPLHRLLHDEPNEYQTAAAFRETFLLNVCLWGIGVAFIDRDDLGRPRGLYPIPSSHVRPQRHGGRLSYEVQMPDGRYTLGPESVYSVATMTLDGVTPLSPVRQSRQAIGLALAMEKYAAKVFANNGNVGGILQTPKMSDQALKDFLASWRKNYTGLDNAMKVALLPDGMKFVATNLDPEKGQLTASRIHQVRDIARVYRVPPHLLGDLEKSSYASTEAQGIEFAKTLLPYTVKLEQEANRKLLLEREKATHEVKVNVDASLRATTLERYRSHTIGRSGGWLSINDIRKMEGLPPVQGGDDLLQPLNMTKVGTQPGGTRALPEPASNTISVSTDAALDIIEDVASRLATKEARAVEKANHKFAGDAEGLMKWAAEFYDQHRDLAARHIAPVLNLAGIDADPAEWAQRYCDDALAELRQHVDEKTPTDDAINDIGGKARRVAVAVLNLRDGEDDYEQHEQRQHDDAPGNRDANERAAAA